MRKLALTSLLALGVAIVLPAQEKTATFEVASVKANRSGDSNGLLRGLPGGRVQATNMPVRQIVMFAYQVAPFQLVGGPAWLTTDRYDLIAKMEETADATPAVPGANAPSPMQLALRNLLEERFKLRARRETRVMEIFALVMARSGGLVGPRMKPTTQDCAALYEAMNRGEKIPATDASGLPICSIQGSPGRLRFGGLPAASLASAFTGPAGRMVVDRTGLEGSWDFDLTFAADNRGGLDALPADPSTPSFFTAIQEQLGLKLESTKGPVDVLVIDSVEKPTED